MLPYADFPLVRANTMLCAEGSVEASRYTMQAMCQGRAIMGLVRLLVGRFLAAVTVVLLSAPGSASAGQETLLEYIKGRDDLTRRERVAWTKAVRLSFGGSALDKQTKERPELGVAKAILSAGIFMRAKPRATARAAREGWTDAMKFVPPPIAIHYWRMALEGRKPRGRPADLAFHFPDYYNEEIAPELVAYWEQAIRDGKIPDYALRETREALAATRIKMRPLLVDKLRLLARLDKEASTARGARRAEIRRDIEAVEDELQAAFTKVPRRPEVVDRRRRPYDRLRIQLEDMGRRLTAEDRALRPVAPRRAPPPPPPPPKAPPKASPPPPKAPPPPPPKAQPRTDRRKAPPPPPPPKTRRRTDRPTPKAKRKNLVSEYTGRLTRAIASWLGTPYRWGNGTKGVGTDCSGFTQGLFKEVFSISLPRVSRDQYRIGRSVSRRQLLPGDLVFFDTLDQGRITHVGVYMGNDRFAHAGSSTGVVYAKLSLRYFRRAYRGARRILAYP